MATVFITPASAALALQSLRPPILPFSTSRCGRIFASGESEEGVRLVSLQCPPELSASTLSEALMEVGAMYVSVSDGNLGTDAEKPIYASHEQDGTMKYESDEPNPESWDELMSAKQLWSNSSLEVGFANSADVERAMLSVLTDAGATASTRYTVDDLAPRDWVTEVQSNWPPVVLPECLTIKFPWHTEADLPSAAPPAVTLHPGMAFGTGEHATTQLCCLALRRLLQASTSSTGTIASTGTTVLDYGSGSGILSFAALLFGASRAVGVEIDVEALATSRLNAAENGFDDRFVAELPDEEAAHGQTYPLVVANILAGTLIELADLIAARVQPGGTLLMSGVWGEEQAERVQAAYSARGFGPFAVKFAEGGWALLEATNNNNANETDNGKAATREPAATEGPPPPEGFVWGAEY